MNWTEIVMLILNLVLGGGFIVTAVTLKQTRAKAETDVQKSNVELVNSSVNDLLESVRTLTTQNNELVEKLVQAEKTNRIFQGKINRLEKKLESFITISEQLVRVFDKIKPPELEKEMVELKKLVTDEKKS